MGALLITTSIQRPRHGDSLLQQAKEINRQSPGSRKKFPGRNTPIERCKGGTSGTPTRSTPCRGRGEGGRRTKPHRRPTYMRRDSSRRTLSTRKPTERSGQDIGRAWPMKIPNDMPKPGIGTVLSHMLHTRRERERLGGTSRLPRRPSAGLNDGRCPRQQERHQRGAESMVGGPRS